MILLSYVLLFVFCFFQILLVLSLIVLSFYFFLLYCEILFYLIFDIVFDIVIDIVCLLSLIYLF
ncbi:hypothetical protein BY996DRAFT_7685892, partial [Phakopsora pachyrhizi]